MKQPLHAALAKGCVQGPTPQRDIGACGLTGGSRLSSARLITSQWIVQAGAAVGRACIHKQKLSLCVPAAAAAAFFGLGSSSSRSREKEKEEEAADMRCSWN